MAHTVLQLPVFDLEPFVRARLRAENPRLREPEGDTWCAHVALLDPFVDEADAGPELFQALARECARWDPLVLRLAEIRRLPGGTTCLAPEPSDRLVAMTEAFAAAFPGHPPRGGAGDRAVPHVPLGHDVPDADLDLLRGWLPQTALVEDVHLVSWSPTEVRTIASFPLRGVAHP